MAEYIDREELKSCPFCGGDAAIGHVLIGAKRYPAWWVRCKLCGATTASHGSEGGEENAVKAWNRRTDDKG